MGVYAVLLIPAKGHEDLIVEGPCGDRVPMVYRSTGCGVGHPAAWQTWSSFESQASCYMCEMPEEALAIAWQGDAHRTVILGIHDRANRVRFPVDNDMVEAVRAGELAEALGWGTLIVLETP